MPLRWRRNSEYVCGCWRQRRAGARPWPHSLADLRNADEVDHRLISPSEVGEQLNSRNPFTDDHDVGTANRLAEIVCHQLTHVRQVFLDIRLVAPEHIAERDVR